MLQLVLSEAPSLYVHAEDRQHRSVSGIRSGVLLIPDGQKPNAPMQQLQQCSVWELLNLSDQQSVLCTKCPHSLQLSYIQLSCHQSITVISRVYSERTPVQ